MTNTASTISTASASSKKKLLTEERAVKNKSADETFGVEGTNKTLAEPQPGAEPSPQLQGTKAKFIEKSPYTRRQ